METFDLLVIGTGGIGSAALYEAARRGARVLGIDRFEPGHDRGSSHGQTRMIRQAYFEHPDYVPLVLHAYGQWAELEQRRGEQLYFETGLLEIGPRDGEVVPGVLASAQQHQLEVDSLSAADVRRRFPGFRMRDDLAAVFERRAGYLRVEACVVGHIEEALRLGARLVCDEAVERWHVDGQNVVIETHRGQYIAHRAIVTAGAWAGQLLSTLSGSLEVRRKPLYWYQTTADHFRRENGCPAFLYEAPQGIFYGFPQIDERGMKIAEHTGGRVVDDPLQLDRTLDRADQARVEAFAAEYLSGLSNVCNEHATCMYTMSPDQNFVVDRHREHPQIVFCAGLSGHGFKFAPALGQALVELALDGETRLPVGFLSADRLR